MDKMRGLSDDIGLARIPCEMQPQKLFDQGPDIFFHVLCTCHEIGPHTVVSIDTTVGGWMKLRHHRALARLPVKRQLRGTLTQLDVPFLKGLFCQDDEVIDAIRAFTRGRDTTVFQEGGLDWENLCRQCKVCVHSTLQQEEQKTQHSRPTKERSARYVGAGTREDPIDLTGEEDVDSTAFDLH